MAGKIKSKPPGVKVGVGGPPETPKDLDLRGQRQALEDELRVRKVATLALTGAEREKASNENQVMRAKIHELSKLIRQAEAPK